MKPKSSLPTTFRWKKEWTGLAILVIALRLVYAVPGIFILTHGGPVELDALLYAALKPYLKIDLFSAWFVNPWFQWDTVSYVRIAMFGYAHDESIAFMPLYPFLIRVTAPLLGDNYLLAALLLSTFFCFVTLVLLYELVAELYQEQLARQTVLFFIAFPTAFFLLAGYTESLFMALVLGFWLLARRRRWGWAASLAGLATLARLQGVILAPVMLWLMLVSLLEKPSSTILGQLRQILALFTDFRRKIVASEYKLTWFATLIPIGASAAYQTWLYYSGLGTITVALKEYWHLETVMPWTGFLLFINRLFFTKFVYMDWVDLALYVIVLAASVIGLRLLDPAFSLYVWLTLAVLLTRGTPPHLLASYSRYFIALFPLFVLPALLRNKHLQAFIVMISFSLQILLAWIFLGGSWVA